MENNCTTKKKRVSKTLIFGILATIFFWPPLGIISIIYSGKAETYTALDNPAKAMMAKEKARFWAVASILIGMLSYFIIWLCS